MREPGAIIFDLDGTLIHSVPDMHVSLNRTLQAFGRDTVDLSTATSFVGNGVERLIARALDATGGVQDLEPQVVVAAFLADYETQKTVLTRPYPGVVDCLERLAAAGMIMGVCTNKPQAPARQMCADLGLERFFTDITGAQEGVPRKPDPASLWAAMDRLGVARDATLYVGDSVVDHDTAAAAGVAFRLYEGGYLNGALPGVAPAARFDDWARVTFAL